MKVLLLAALMGGALAAGTDEAIKLKVGDIAPNFEGTWLNHPDSSLADFTGRLVFIEAWRTW